MPGRDSKRGGFSLIEVVVILGLLSLLTLVLADFLLDLTRASGRADVRAGLQSQALVHSEAMLATLRQTTLTGLAVRSDPASPGFAATPLSSVTTTGQRVWAQELSMYYWQPSQHTLYLQHSPPIALPAGKAFQPSDPPELTSTELAAMFSGGRALCERVTEFEISLQDDHLRLKLALEQSVPNAPSQRCETVREMTILSP
jgi:hypothetical protein